MFSNYFLLIGGPPQENKIQKNFNVLTVPYSTIVGISFNLNSPVLNSLLGSFHLIKQNKKKMASVKILTHSCNFVVMVKE